MVRQQRVDLERQHVRLAEVANADGAASDLVLIGRTDAAARGADLLRASGALARLVERGVVGQDQRAGLGDAKPRDHASYAARFELVDLRQQGLRREHHAVADEAVDVAAQDARGNQVQHGLLAADHQRVAGVVAALEAHHALGAVGEPVDDLALALVAPLGADDDDVASTARHLFFFLVLTAEARLLSSIENPVAARGRPNALPTSS